MSAVTQASAGADKIALFRSLFRGRTDVYPARFESRKTGKSGYQPACGNEWVRGICEKPRIKCSDCPHQCWLPVTDAYRRDRRKDVLLQQNGCLVLRFLAEDVGRRLDQLLDAILAALANRRRFPHLTAG